MRRLIVHCLCVATLLSQVACQKDFDAKHTAPEGPVIPFDFDWKMTRDAAVAVGYPTVDGKYPDFALINIYASPVLVADNLLAQGMVNTTNTTFRTAFTLPERVENIYVQTIAPDGSRVVKMVPVTSSQISIEGARMSGATPVAARELRVALLAQSASEMKVTSLIAPVTESVPTSFDSKIESTPKQKLYIGGNASISSYIIPAGVTIDDNINMVGWTNNHPILYVAGKLDMDALDVEKTRLVVLAGGEVVLSRSLSMNNLFNDKASVYVMPGGKLTAGTVTLAAGSFSLMVNHGDFSITRGDLTMKGGKIYTSTGINSSEAGLKYKPFKIRGSYAELHSDGILNLSDVNFDAQSSFVNYENGVVNLDKLALDQSVLDQRGTFTAEEMKLSSRVTVNNRCLITTEDIHAQAQSVINLAAGSVMIVENAAKFHQSTVNFADQSMLIVDEMDEGSYVSYFVGPVASGNDGAKAVFCLEDMSDKAGKWNPHVLSGALELVCDESEGFRCQGGATIVSEQTVDIAATECNGGKGSITPAPVEPKDEFDVPGAKYTYSFEDGWPWFGDYDMNDLVVVVSVDRKMKDGKIEALRINWNPRASGADNKLAFALSLDRVLTSNIASITASHVVGAGAFVVENGLEQDNDYAVIPLFNTVGEVFNSSEKFINTEIGKPVTAHEKYTTVVTFVTPVSAEDAIESALNFFVVATRSDAPEPERWREIHLSSYKPTKHAVVAGFSTVIEEMPYKFYAQGGDLSNNGLMWGLMIPGEFNYPAEFNDIRTVYNQFMPWAKSGGMSHKNWYEGDFVSDKIYK